MLLKTDLMIIITLGKVNIFSRDKASCKTISIFA